MAGLSRGGFDLELAPEVGGAVRRFAFQGRDILRPLKEGSADALDSGCFPLLPYANRIAHGVFRFEGREVRLEPNLPGHPHPLHGQAWRKRWRVSGRDNRSITLDYEHARGEGGWPWSYRAQQIFQLGDAGLRIELSVTNTADEAMPVGLGFHPYLTAAPGCRVRTRVEGVWLNDETQIPSRLAAPDTFADWAAGAELPALGPIDNCHTGWSGDLTFATPDWGTWSLTASPNLRWLHIYAPGGADFFCAEPVSQMPDAFNRPAPPEETGMDRLEPGETRAAWMALEVCGAPA